MVYRWSPTFLPVPPERPRGNPLNSTEFGKKVLKERGLGYEPDPERVTVIKTNPTALFLFFRPVFTRVTVEPGEVVRPALKNKVDRTRYTPPEHADTFKPEVVEDNEAKAKAFEKRAAEATAARKREIERAKVYQEYYAKAKQIPTTYLLAVSSLTSKQKKKYDELVKEANERRKKAGKPTK